MQYECSSLLPFPFTFLSLSSETSHDGFVAVESLLLHVQEVCNSDFDLKTDYPVRGFSCFSQYFHMNSGTILYVTP
jgi:hypothetical protein